MMGWAGRLAVTYYIFLQGYLYQIVMWSSGSGLLRDECNNIRFQKPRSMTYSDNLDR